MIDQIPLLYAALYEEMDSQAQHWYKLDMGDMTYKYHQTVEGAFTDHVSRHSETPDNIPDIVDVTITCTHIKDVYDGSAVLPNTDEYNEYLEWSSSEYDHIPSNAMYYATCNHKGVDYTFKCPGRGCHAYYEEKVAESHDGHLRSNQSREDDKQAGGPRIIKVLYKGDRPPCAKI